ncbi:MAG: amidophosphoribosyltransferase [Deltaproteobacteria bacterium]|jgi:amidophosphoribosyltransferase|nr:Amidophosphoribosyltransferase [bacterium HR37]GIW47248.1 MAG: amidophosphoribosyltransferase [Deltaproteobacteria bacterium]
MLKEIREECGIFGIYGHPEAANLTYLGLHALQHRGQESAGIVTSDGFRLYTYKDMGLVSDIFTEDVLSKLPGKNAIGHVRYSTSGSSHPKNSQPIVVTYSLGELAIAHNGNLTNAKTLREELEQNGAIFQSTTDTEVIVHLIARSREQNPIRRIVEALSMCKGAYSLLFLSPESMVAVRDPFGFRPLVMGRLGDSVVFASETCAFDLIEATFEREVEPGEVVVVSSRGIESIKPFPEVKRHAYCVFEFIYFARPDSFLFGRNVYQIRKELGKQLAREQPANADIVVAVPDSGVPAAIGYSEESGLPLELGLLRSHYVGRTFIEPQQSIRNFGVKVKLNAIREVLSGKRVVIVDDSIVRGTTSRKIVKMIRAAGAKEVHMRISSPPMCFSCYYGVDTPIREELIASSLNIDEINKYITSDTLGYLSLEGVMRAVTSYKQMHGKENFCDACFTGNYPVEIVDSEIKIRQLRLFDR